MIKVLLVDDHAMFRAGVKQMLGMYGDIEVAGEAADGRAALTVARETNPDVILLDISMPEADGFTATVNLVRSLPDAKIIILTMHDNPEYAARLLKTGAKGYLLKSGDPKELPEAIRNVAEGRLHIATELIEKLLLLNSLEESVDPLSKLTDREFHVFSRSAAGQTAARISKEMNIGVSTVATYKKRAMQKLGVNNTSELIKLAIKLNVIEES